MRVDFYHLGRDPAERVVAGIARNTLKAGERLLVVSADPELAARIDVALWEDQPDDFLAHGRAGTSDDARQPILLSDELQPANGARYCAIADGTWRDGGTFERIFYLFGGDQVPAARECWKVLRRRDGIERRYWAQSPAGRWEQKG